MVELQQVVNVLGRHKDELPGANIVQKGRYFQSLSREIQRLIKRSDEDRRLATQIAVDASKAFVQIAIAVFVAIGGFFQFGFNNKWDTLPVSCLGVAALLTVLSMRFGFVVISNAYKRGDGRTDIDQVAWCTEALKRSINSQAWTGVAALLVFALSIVLQNPASSASPQIMKIALPKKVAKTISSLKPVKVTGQWSRIAIEQQGNFILQLEPVPDKQTRSFTLEFE